MPITITRTVGLGIAVSLLVLAAAVATPAAAAHTGDDEVHPEFTVALESDGAATVTVQYTYDLETDAERQAFMSLENDEDERATATNRFTARMARVAADASNATNRSMHVDKATIDVRTAGDSATGVVTFTLNWTGLARVENQRLILTEPFASGYSPDRTFSVQVPPGYRLATTTPDPAAANDTRATWEPGTDLQGFRVVAEPSGDGGETNGTGTGGLAPGFGVLAGMVGLLGALLLLRRRRA